MRAVATCLRQACRSTRGKSVLPSVVAHRSTVQNILQNPRAFNSMAGDQQYEYDLVTIGAGSGGVRASRFAAQYYGAKVAVVELPFGFVSSDTVGGKCSATMSSTPPHTCSLNAPKPPHYHRRWRNMRDPWLCPKEAPSIRCHVQ
jgi:hypothetical protein